VGNGSFSNEYFKLDFPLPRGWEEDMAGPIPSASGYYVLARLRTHGDLKGMVSIDAQDMFFSVFPISDAMDAVKRREHQAAFDFHEVIDSAPQETSLGGHRFVHYDHTGVPYHRATFSTVIRCHVLTFEITSRFPDVLNQIEENMGRLSLLNIPDPASGGGPVPVCVKDYATDATVIHRVDPEMAGPLFTNVPTRFVIDTTGKVKHIHVINALPDQAKSVENALAQWVFKPYLVNGKPVEVETGILFEFPPSGQRQNIAISSH
jgi:hypothetical protein